MNNCKIAFVFLLCVMLTGCIASQNLEGFCLRNIFPELPGIKVYARLIGTTKIIHIPCFYSNVQDTSPYSAFLAFDGNYKKITIRSIFVQINNSNSTPILKESDQPVILVPNETDTYYTSSYWFNSIIELDFKKTESLNLVVDLSYIQGDKEESNVIECHFEPSLFKKRSNYLLDLISSV